MKNMILSFIMKVRNGDIYKKKPFPYDMRQAVSYAEQTGRQVYELTDTEMERFLLPKRSRTKRFPLC